MKRQIDKLEVTYRLIAQVDDETVFDSEYPDTLMLQEELDKAERAVEHKFKLLVEES